MFIAFHKKNELRIDCLSMDGNITSLSNVLNDKAMKPFSMMYFDAATRRLFWFSTTDDYIESVNQYGEYLDDISGPRCVDTFY